MGENIAKSAMSVCATSREDLCAVVEGHIPGVVQELGDVGRVLLGEEPHWVIAGDVSTDAEAGGEEEK